MRAGHSVVTGHMGKEEGRLGWKQREDREPPALRATCQAPGWAWGGPHRVPSPHSVWYVDCQGAGLGCPSCFN